MPKLIVSFPVGGEKSFDLEADVITVGRLDDNLIIIDDASVSSHHATLTLRGESYHLQDLNSTNGTRVNGEPSNAALLAAGDRIRFGKIECHLASDNSSENRPMPQAENPSAELASATSVPSDFSNASSFKTKEKSKNGAGVALIGFSVVSILAFVAALASVFMLKPPH